MDEHHISYSPMLIFGIIKKTTIAYASPKRTKLRRNTTLFQRDNNVCFKVISAMFFFYKIFFLISTIPLYGVQNKPYVALKNIDVCITSTD